MDPDAILSAWKPRWHSKLWPAMLRREAKKEIEGKLEVEGFGVELQQLLTEPRGRERQFRPFVRERLQDKKIGCGTRVASATI